MLDVSEDRAGAGLQAIATGLGASAESRPARHLAVDRAALGVAHTVFLRRAFITAVLGSDVHIVVATLRTGATALGAGSPGVPGVFAVDGARMGVAVSDVTRELIHRSARNAAVLSMSYD